MCVRGTEDQTMRKVGILGGTFNPIHNGHLAVARKAKEQCALDEVIFMPCGAPYMKCRQEVAPGSVRAEMTALAIEGIPGFTMSSIELEKQGNTYTYETMEYLHTGYPEQDLYFILGADSLFSIAHWKYPERIFACCHIVAALRDEIAMTDMKRQIECLKAQYDVDIVPLKMENIDISSSDIRRKISAGEPIGEFVPENVREYIVKNGLYQ